MKIRLLKHTGTAADIGLLIVGREQTVALVSAPEVVFSTIRYLVAFRFWNIEGLFTKSIIHMQRLCHNPLENFTR